MRAMRNTGPNTLRHVSIILAGIFVAIFPLHVVHADAAGEREQLVRVIHELQALEPLLRAAQSQANPDARAPSLLWMRSRRPTSTPSPSTSSSSSDWPEDGARDFGRAIFRVSPYMTPKYRAELLSDLELKGRKGELAYRVRGVQEVPGHGFEERRVDILDDGVWVVWLDLDLFESVKGMTVKKTAIRYPLRVVRHAVDLEANPWGLALDGFSAEGPRRMTAAELTGEDREAEEQG